MIIAAVVLFAVTVMAGAGALAEDRTFLGLQVTKIEGTYLVTKGVNVRAGPKTGSKKLGTLKAGSKVTVVGRAKGGAGWMAINRDGKEYGFVYAPVMLPMIDGTLTEKVSGTVQIEEHAPCGYTFEFRGKNTVDGEDYVFSDYEISYRCNDKGRPFTILAPMFMTEVPYQLTHKAVFQISIDLMEIENGYDEIYSTTFHYLPEQKKITFAGVSIKKQGRSPKIKERAVNSIAEALSAAVEIAPDAWSAEVWEQLSKVLVEN
ncbi:MAG: SH3 domain-containing protein [Rhodospirillaceae bacterium]|jgi:hypothetical protein|nr:SH3 domain-containing protein [Rhodospirillaceae bacterium]MBT5245757.1 SH3 domain-containing protein [Rhodospirillaceae bacterium]MBT5561453.1 SH3 domain-containing protein [Rhodospirillaceae bacterium]MBT6242947.1 SH3 domain-containing protein [Rhodospirillaceae bacterium]MBT7138067.1 SH3 domain-containing protein [Rhodospirillaceae bacterium]